MARTIISRSVAGVSGGAAVPGAFKPFLAVLYGYPDFPVVLHYSGLLLEWLEDHHPEFITLLGEMVRRGQVEVLGGGYYDPILPMIPTNDKLGQLEKMTTHLRVRFETRPRGCWLAESVWEPSLAFVLRASGMDYTFLDESQFRLAGAEGPDLLRPAIAEEQGKIVSVFPIAAGLAPFTQEPRELLGRLKDLAGARPGALSCSCRTGTSRGHPRNGWRSSSRVCWTPRSGCGR